MSSAKEKVFSYYCSPIREGVDSPCAFEGCREQGLHKAIKNPKMPQHMVLLCEDHIRIHNQGLDYFKGMSSADIEKEIQADFSWRRPTWPLGKQREKLSFYFEDPLDIQKRVRAVRSQHADRMHKAHLKMPANVQEAVECLGITLPITLVALKKVYKTKVKLFHPDVNKGSKAAEEKFKQVNEAYKLLTSYLF
ncbi:MAG: J domain-containing protein [Alphaproteobacteria bacterium]